jgi:hypothetical protein
MMEDEDSPLKNKNEWNILKEIDMSEDFYYGNNLEFN